MSFCPICGAHHDPNMPCADRAGEVLRDAGIAPIPPSLNKNELKTTTRKANRILLVLLFAILGIFLLMILVPNLKSSRQNANSAKAHIISGNELRNQGDYKRAIADFNEAITSGTLSTEDLAVAYYGRGATWYEKGDYDDALADFSEAIRLNPKLAYAYCGRGLTWHSKGEDDKAVADYSEAIRRDTNFAGSYENRGLIRFNKGEFSSASEDLAKAQELKPYIYTAISLYLARERSNNDGRNELGINSAYMDTEKWPAAVVKLYLGKGDIRSVISQASHYDLKKSKEQMCEANFFLGEWHLLRNEREPAIKFFNKARVDCPRDFYENDTAIAELERLKESAKM